MVEQSLSAHSFENGIRQTQIRDNLAPCRRGHRVQAHALGTSADNCNAMTSADDAHRAGTAKERCVKCAYPISSANDVFGVIQCFKEMLNHVGYTTSRFVMDEKEAGCINFNITLRPSSRCGKASSSKAHVHEDPQTGVARHCNLGTSSCCSTNSLCKAHACRHREEASKPASSPVAMPPPDLPFAGDAQNEPPQYSTEALPMAGSDRTNSQQASRQHHLFGDKGQPPSVSMAHHQSGQKLDTVDQITLHRSPNVAVTMGLLSAQHLDPQKTMTAAEDEAASRGMPAVQVPHSRSIAGVGDSRNMSSTASRKTVSRSASVLHSERHVQQEQGLAPVQGQHTRLWGGADRLSGTIEPLFQRSIHVSSLQAGSLQAGGLQGRNFPRSVAPDSRRSMQTAQTHALQQPGEALAHEISRGLSTELQIIDQSSDYPPLAALADEHMHGPSSLGAPQVAPVPSVPPRLSLQQAVNQSSDWQLSASRADSALGNTEQTPDPNRLSEDARVAAQTRLDFGATARHDSSPAAKRARTGGGVLAVRVPADTVSADGAADGGASSPGITRCRQCAKSFINELDLQQHEAKDHSIPAPKNVDGRYLCTVEDCDQSFVRRHVMKRHVKTVHLKIREFECEACGRAFADSSTREVHRSAVHEKKRPWSCDMCPSSFTQSSSLGKHKRRFHGEQKGAKGASSSHLKES